MKTTFIALAVVAALAMPASAQETRTIVDDSGTEVTIPADPQRIVALHDLSLTVPLLELGVRPVGSHGRTRADGTPFIRASAQITGVDFDSSDIAFVGNNPADVEAVAELDPDLILTVDWQDAPLDQLRAIAPTVMFDGSMTDDWAQYDRLAEITGRPDRLAAMKRRYAAQIDLISGLLDTSDITVSTIHARGDGDLFAFNPYGNLGKVLTDAGFDRPDAIEEIPAGTSEDFSVETLPQFDGDFLLATYRSSAGETPADMRAKFEASVPGYCQLLHACRNDQMVLLSRAEATTTSYDALTSVAYAVLSVIGGREFTPMTE